MRGDLQMDNTKSNGTFRTKINPFTQVSNAIIRDINLSLKAKGLYSLIQSFITIPDFILYKSYLMSICKEKEKAFDSAWKELKVNGYLKQYRIPKGKNDSFVYEYELLDVADLTTPPLVNLNKNGEEVKSKEEENSHTPHFGAYAESDLAYPPFRTLCEGHPMPNGGGINNTDINNTNYNNIDILSNPIPSVLKESPEKEKTDKIGSDEIPSQSVKNKESSQNAPTFQSIKQKELPTTNIDYNIILEKIKENIKYNCMIHDNPEKSSMIDGIVHVIASTVVSDFEDGYIKLGNEKIPAEVVKSTFLKLGKDDIDYFIENFNKQILPTVKLNAYIRSALYKNYGTKDFYWANRVRVDMPYLSNQNINIEDDL